MRIIAKKALRAFWETHPEAEEPLLAWYREVEREDEATPQLRSKRSYGNASIIGDNRVVLNLNPA
jgi:mRNA interferase HigB